MPSSAKYVTVACKLPHGLILRRFNMVERQELVMGGGYREVKVAQDTGERFVINGTAHAAGKMPSNRNQAGMPDADLGHLEVSAGFALTHNVPADLWEGWLRDNKDSAYVRNGLVYAHAQLASVKSWTREHEKQRSGLEPLDPERPDPMIKPADEMKGRSKAPKSMVE